MVSKATIIKIVAVCLFFHVCLAEEQTIPYPKGEDGDKVLENQFIIEFQQSKEGKESKQMLLNGNRDDEDAPRVIRRIESRNISVVKFRSRLAVARWLKRAKGVKYFERDVNAFLHEAVLLRNAGKPRNLSESTPYGINHVEARNVPDTNSSSRKVCIIDSGYDKSHEDLPDDPTIVTGKSFLDGDETWYTDGNSHGTHVAGIIAALGGNNIGVKGVIRNGRLKLHIAKIFGASGGAPTSTVIAAFEDCVAEGSNVINMSLGSSGWSSSFQDAIQGAHEKGVLVFASAGNNGSSTYNYPASYDHVTSVASITKSKFHSYFSTYNDKVDISAPGSNVLSTVPGNGYEKKSGTSMACPHAAGVAALVWSNFPTLPAEQLRSTLESTATDLPLETNDGRDDKYGHGLINAKAAYDAILAFRAPTVSPAAPSSMPTVFCADGVVVQVDVKTDSYGGSESSWDITNINGDIVAQHGSFGDNILKSTKVCLERTPTCSGRDYIFTIYDSFGDGLCCNWGSGYYEVWVDDELLVSGAEFGHTEANSLCKQDDEPSICDQGGKQICNDTNGCYWFPNDTKCYDCSRISEDLGRGKSYCERFGCTWNGSSCE